MWLHACADGLIALAYFSIPAAIFYVLRRRPDYPFRGTILGFGIFISACGLTHVLEIVSIWQPIYWTSGFVKAATAVISLTVAVTVWRMQVLFLAAPTPEHYRRLSEELDQLVRERTTDLTTTNALLAAEIEQRRSAEKYSEDLNQTLFERVADLHTLIDILPAGVAIATDPQCHEVRHNRAFARLFELEDRAHPLDDPLDRREFNAVRVFRDGLELPVPERPMQRTAATGRPAHDIELRLLLPSGAEREVLVSVEPLLDVLSGN